MNNSKTVPFNGRLITPVLIAGCVIIGMSFAIRASFGVFQIPIASEFGWPRIEFSLAIAIQNLAWGIGQPIFGAIAEKIGDRFAVVIGTLLYATGLVLSSMATTPIAHHILEIVIGFGIAGTGFGVILAVIGRSSSDANRSLSLGIATAAGSAGQVFGAPVAEWLLRIFPWQTVFFIFAFAILTVLLTLPAFKSDTSATSQELEETLGNILKKAFGDPTYSLIFAGFFSCGYQLALITAHFPAFVAEFCSSIAPTSLLHSLGFETTAALGALAISVIGLANIVGTIVAGWLGKFYSRKYMLALIYALRAISTIIFVISPITPFSVLIFSAVMGVLWLATVPLTSGLIAHIYGLRYMGTLYGIIFFSHQLGGFLGVWLGGYLYDIYGNYDLVWWIGIGVAAFSTLVHIPINEKPLAYRKSFA